jgi:putative endonuclease
MKRRDTGNYGEKLARDFLKEKGYHIMSTNYRCPHGEIDIIASDKSCLVFVEVRAKKSNTFGTPEESITTKKMGKLRDTANHYLQNNDNPLPQWRIDFVGVELDRKGKLSQIEHIEYAVGEE